MESDYLILRRASAFRPSGEWNDDDYDVLCNGVVVGRIMQAAAVPVGMSWMWTLAFGGRARTTTYHVSKRARGVASCSSMASHPTRSRYARPKGLRHFGVSRKAWFEIVWNSRARTSSPIW